MTTRPGYIWSGTEWIAIGQEAVLAPVSYQATAPTTPATGDIWIESDVDVPSIDSAQFLRWRKTMTGGETSLSGNDDSSLPLQYTPGYEQLYINGVLQVRGQDYTATTGTTVTGLTALVANDVVEIFSAVARTVADVYTQTQSDARFVNRNVGGLTLVSPTSVTGGTISASGAVTINSAVSSVTVNGCFSATYDAYKIIVTGGSASTSGNITLALNGITTNYHSNLVYQTYLVNAVNGATAGPGSSFIWAGNYTTSGIVCDVDLYSPFLVSPKRYFAKYGDMFSSGGAAGTATGLCTTTTSSSGFSIAASSGTLTGGTIRIYGYNNGA